jgi:hypothetical protein
MNFFDQVTSEILRNYAVIVGGAFGLYMGWLRVTASNRQAEAQLKQSELARRAHVAELFNRAVGQLKDKKLEVRFGAILTLEQVCRDFPDLAKPVLQLLTTYLQQNTLKYGDKPPPNDVLRITDILREFKK